MVNKTVENLITNIDISIELSHIENAIKLIHYLFSIEGKLSSIRKYIPFLY